MAIHDPKAVALAFNRAITNRSLEELAALMSARHTFIDSSGQAFAGKQRALDAWRGFFEQFPDYRNIFSGTQVHGDTVIMTGRSDCSDRRLRGPAIWSARVRAGRVTEWRVHEDTPAQRQKLGLGPA